MNFRNLPQLRESMRVMQVFQKMDKHIVKRCAYCNMELGNEVPIIDFAKHLEEKHKEKINEKEIREYLQFAK